MLESVDVRFEWANNAQTRAIEDGSRKGYYMRCGQEDFWAWALETFSYHKSLEPDPEEDVVRSILGVTMVRRLRPPARRERCLY